MEYTVGGERRRDGRRVETGEVDEEARKVVVGDVGVRGQSGSSSSSSVEYRRRGGILIESIVVGFSTVGDVAYKTKGNAISSWSQYF